MKVHFFMIVAGGKRELEFQAEVFLNSLERFGNLTCCMTICKNKGDKIRSRLLRAKTEIISSDNEIGIDPAWYSCLGHVPVKGDVTIYTDADIMIVDDLNYIVNTCWQEQSVCGVLAQYSPFHNQVDKRTPEDQRIPWKKKDWKYLFNACGLKLPKDKYVPLINHYSNKYKDYSSPYYVNMGFVAVPTKFIPALNKQIPRYLVASDNALPNHYHRPQFALCLAIEHLQLQKTVMPIWCNCPDHSPILDHLDERPIAGEKPLVLHVGKLKSAASNWKKLRDYAKVAPRKFVREKIQTIIEYRKKTGN